MHITRGLTRLQRILLCGFCIIPLLTVTVFGVIHFRGGRRPSFFSTSVPTVWVVSHRRSGTHLTMDLLARVIEPPYRLVKTNHIYLSKMDTPDAHKDGLNCKCLRYLRRTGKIIHAHRDVRDVVTSTYYYYRTFNPSFMKGINRTDFFNNKNNIRNRVIGTWVNTTVPWFSQPDVLQLYFTDSASGLEHVYDKIAKFLGKSRQDKGPVGDVRNLKTVSSVVSKGAGRGDHGYKLELSTKIQEDIMRTARKLHLQARKNMLKCSMRTSFAGRLWHSIADSLSEGFWVGSGLDKQGHGLFAPDYCPPVLKTAKVYVNQGEEKAR